MSAMLLAGPHLTVVRDALANTMPPLRPHTRSAGMVCAHVLVRMSSYPGYALQQCAAWLCLTSNSVAGLGRK